MLFIALVTVISMTLFLINDPYGLKELLLLTALAVLPLNRNENLSVIDVTIWMMWGQDVLLCFYGINQWPCFQTLCLSTMFLLTYFLFKQITKKTHILLLYLQFLCIIIGIAVILSLISFAIFYHSTNTAGFENCYAFRFLFKPLGYNTNTWTTVLVAAMGIIVIAYQKRAIGSTSYTILMIITLLTTILSFSRGTLISLGILLFLLILAIKSIHEKIRLIVIGGVVGVLTFACFTKEMRLVVGMNTTVSQRESIDGRIEATYAAMKIIPEYKWFGVGNGNYTLAIDKELNQDTNKAYSNFAPNIIVQTLVEKGIVGCIVGIYWLIGIGIYAWKGKKDVTCRISAVFLSTLLLKEMSQSTLSVTPVACMIMCFFLALMQNKNHSLNRNISQRSFLKYALLIGGIGAFIISKGVYLTRNNGIVPQLINKSVAEIRSFQQDSLTQHLDQSQIYLQLAKKQQSKDIHIDYLLGEIEALKGNIECLKKFTKQYPKNALYQYRCFKHLYKRGEKQEAATFLVEAIILNPRILLLEDINIIEKVDNIFYQVIRNRLLQRLFSQTEDAILTARYGFIAYQLGEEKKACSLLENAVISLPNLSTPWMLIGKLYENKGDIEKAKSCFQKYRLLTYGAFTYKTLSDTIELRAMKEEDLTAKYAMKFQIWYGSTYLY